MTALASLAAGPLEMRDIVLVAAWVVAAGIVFLSLCPESIRPHLAEPEFERFAAYFLAGSLFFFAYPDQPVYVALGVVLSAVAFETIQYALPHRHAHFPDARDGAMGGFLGVVAGAVASRLFGLLNGAQWVDQLLRLLFP